jgi:hypothetical protein
VIPVAHILAARFTLSELICEACRAAQRNDLHRFRALKLVINRRIKEAQADA